MSEFLHLDDDPSARRLAYLGAALLILIPFLQAGQQLWPLQLSDIRWRFQAATALSSILLLPFLGLTMVTMVARATENTAISRVAGTLAALFFVGLLGSMVLFALDALQLKSIVPSQSMSPFQTMSLRVVLATAIFTGAFFILMITAFKSSRARRPATSRAARPAAAPDAALLVRR
ncbi:MAG: hypothetical protein WCK74_00710 [Gemmatimonadaceae bacterium]